MSCGRVPSVLEEFARLLEAGGELDDATDVVRRLIASDPLREDSHATLIRLHALADGVPMRCRRTSSYAGFSTTSSAWSRRPRPKAGGGGPLEGDRAQLSADLWERVGDLRVMSGDAAGAARYVMVLDAGGRRGAPQRKCAELGSCSTPEPPRLNWQRRRCRLDEGGRPSAPAGPTTPGRRGSRRRSRMPNTPSWPRAGRHGGGPRRSPRSAGDRLALPGSLARGPRVGAGTPSEEADDRPSCPRLRLPPLHRPVPPVRGRLVRFGRALRPPLLDRAEEAGAVRAQAFAWCLLGESPAAGALGRIRRLPGTKLRPPRIPGFPLSCVGLAAPRRTRRVPRRPR